MELCAKLCACLWHRFLTHNSTRDPQGPNFAAGSDYLALACCLRQFCATCRLQLTLLLYTCQVCRSLAAVMTRVGPSAATSAVSEPLCKHFGVTVKEVLTQELDPCMFCTGGCTLWCSTSAALHVWLAHSAQSACRCWLFAAAWHGAQLHHVLMQSAVI